MHDSGGAERCELPLGLDSTIVASMDLSGKFIVIDGPDGAGKGTQLERLKAWIEAEGGACELTRDPGGTVVTDPAHVHPDQPLEILVEKGTIKARVQ